MPSKPHGLGVEGVTAHRENDVVTRVRQAGCRVGRTIDVPLQTPQAALIGANILHDSSKLLLIPTALPTLSLFAHALLSGSTCPK